MEETYSSLFEKLGYVDPSKVAEEAVEKFKRGELTVNQIREKFGLSPLGDRELTDLISGRGG